MRYINKVAISITQQWHSPRVSQISRCPQFPQNKTLFVWVRDSKRKVNDNYIDCKHVNILLPLSYHMGIDSHDSKGKQRAAHFTQNLRCGQEKLGIGKTIPSWRSIQKRSIKMKEKNAHCLSISTEWVCGCGGNAGGNKATSRWFGDPASDPLHKHPCTCCKSLPILWYILPVQQQVVRVLVPFVLPPVWVLQWACRLQHCCYYNWLNMIHSKNNLPTVTIGWRKGMMPTSSI